MRDHVAERQQCTAALQKLNFQYTERQSSHERSSWLGASVPSSRGIDRDGRDGRIDRCEMGRDRREDRVEDWWKFIFKQKVLQGQEDRCLASR
ncbi:hypothetical protein C2845_PM12G20110 [Panicum miliaceum]|uniref:Uncharacterized protein n=1 Tax=Panicum miliaceum TaxID=4540 RepID=A0A3L6QJH5_PANMI|nr:hypothetical protein C2845_PM12G20110 [Panicum miliaceum]